MLRYLVYIMIYTYYRTFCGATNCSSFDDDYKIVMYRHIVIIIGNTIDLYPINTLGFENNDKYQ